MGGMKFFFIYGLIIVLFFDGCSSKKRMEGFYERNKDKLWSLVRECSNFKDKYLFTAADIRNTGCLGMNIKIESPYKSITVCFKKENLSVTSYSGCDKCTIEEKQKYLSMGEDTILKNILRNYIDIQPRAIAINKNGVFVILADPIKKSGYWSESEAGIFMSFVGDVDSVSVLKRIDTNAYLFEDNVYAW